MTLRRIALAAIFMNVIFNGFYTAVLNTPTIGEVTAAYPAYFSPAPYAFSIWFFIFTAFIVYGIIQVLPSKRDHTIYGTLSPYIIIVNLLSILWIITYTKLYFGVSFLILGLMLAGSFRLFFLAHRAVLYQNHNLWLQLPFCLMAAWLSVAIMAMLAVYLRSENVSFYFGEGVMTILMILLAFGAGLWINSRTSSLVFPAVIAWGLLAVHSARKEDAAPIAGIALSCAILLPLITLMAALFKKVKRGESMHPSH